MADLSSLLVRIRTGLEIVEFQARAATEGTWKVGRVSVDGAASLTASDAGGKVTYDVWAEDAAHIAAWQPEVVLATVTVLRTLVDGYAATLASHVHDPVTNSCRWCGYAAWPCPDSYRTASSLEALSRLPFIGGDTNA